ncbi:hypothetical protein [Endozoicomonas euniceicola]|uniref:YfhD family protein n=1 Tax=Endozoicomonas euniceicola TaxID=1234143 RepID=A0ABY6H3G8_9GAMM|nr:hypothetical protein [Endozoicomonas euniceicola]UYM18796.1 hypothetical protein NX720_06610 [Endozoicomonas euniceicola]
MKYQEGMTDLTVDPELDTGFGDVFGQEDEARQKQLKQAGGGEQ